MRNPAIIGNRGKINICQCLEEERGRGKCVQQAGIRATTGEGAPVTTEILMVSGTVRMDDSDSIGLER